MYEAATRNEVLLADRKGNWVQKYHSDEDALRYATAQFHRFQEVERFLEEQFSARETVMRRVEEDHS